MEEVSELTYEEALAGQLYLLTESDQIKEQGEYPDSPIPQYAGITSEHKTTLHVVTGYHVPSWLQSLKELHPERIVWELMFDGEHEEQHESGKCTYIPVTVQLYYVREKSMEELIAEQFNWGKIQEELEKADSEPRHFDEEAASKRVYVGTILQLSPSGKYYTSFANSNVTDEEVEQDEAYWKALDELLSSKGMWRESGEGSACDLFFCRVAFGGEITVPDFIEKASHLVGRSIEFGLRNGHVFTCKFEKISGITIEVDNGAADLTSVKSVRLLTH